MIDVNPTPKLEATFSLIMQWINWGADKPLQKTPLPIVDELPVMRQLASVGEASLQYTPPPSYAANYYL